MFNSCDKQSNAFGRSDSSSLSLQTHDVYSTLKRRGNGRFHVVSTWSTRGLFVGQILSLYPLTISIFLTLPIDNFGH